MSDAWERELEMRARIAYRSAPPLSREARDRLLDQVRSVPPPKRRRFALSLPGDRLRTLAALAGTAAVAIAFVSVTALDRAGRPPAPSPPKRAAGVASGPPATSAEAQFVSFRIRAAGAEQVALVGDFNGWDPQAAPMERAGPADTWAVTVAVPRGRHLYGFLINGRRWLADPVAPLAPEDGYGAPNSVVIVGALAAS